MNVTGTKMLFLYSIVGHEKLYFVTSKCTGFKFSYRNMYNISIREDRLNTFAMAHYPDNNIISLA